jgi:hypothetical protein
MVLEVHLAYKSILFNITPNFVLVWVFKTMFWEDRLGTDSMHGHW